MAWQHGSRARATVSMGIRQRLRRAACLCGALGLALAPVTAAADGELSALVAAARSRNPQIDALQAQIRALEAKTRQAGAWQDPKLQLAYQNAPVDSFALGREPMTAVVIGLEQTVPWFGKTEERQRVVRHSGEAKRYELEEKRNELSALVKAAYYRLALSRQLRALTRDHVALVEQLLAAVRAKYEVGRTEQQNLLRLQVLRDRLADDIEDFERQERQLTAAINATLDRPVDTAIGTPDTLALRPPSQELAELKSRALAKRPALKQLSANARMYQSATELAEHEAAPDPTFFAAYALRTPLPGGNPGRDLVSLGVRVPLPLFYSSNFGARASEARAQASAVEASRRALLTAIAGELADALAVWERAARKLETYRTKLLPEAHQTLDATFANYRVDRADFTSLYEAEIEVLGFEKTVRTAAVDGLIARTSVERLVGETLP